tara:strand:- start:60 stop:803 length:744 start_codon:yes stop_codon:yes gene_type:complete
MTKHVIQRELPNFSSVLDELGLTEEDRVKTEKALTVLGGGVGEIIDNADQDQQTRARNGTAIAELVDAKFFTEKSVHWITNPSIKYIEGGKQVNCAFYHVMNYGTSGIKSDKGIPIDFSMAFLRNVYEYFKMPVDPATGEESDKTMLEMQMMPVERRTLLLTDFQKAQVDKVNKGIGKAFDKQRAIAKKLLGLSTTDTRPANVKLAEALAKKKAYFEGLENSDLDVKKIVDHIQRLIVLLTTRMPKS